jgi:NTP pyrophosphatase (non-canonical NTP hydrolase)
MILDINEVQSQVGRWAKWNFGEQEPSRPLLGVVEELGELAHAQLKGEQGIREGLEEAKIHDMKVDAIGDLLIYLLHYCCVSNLSLQSCLLKTWSHVRQRDWVRNPEDGKSEPRE